MTDNRTIEQKIKDTWDSVNPGIIEHQIRQFHENCGPKYWRVQVPRLIDSLAKPLPLDELIAFDDIDCVEFSFSYIEDNLIAVHAQHGHLVIPLGMWHV